VTDGRTVRITTPKTALAQLRRAVKSNAAAITRGSMASMIEVVLTEVLHALQQTDIDISE